ncbi:MAG: hypothetical protein GY950_07675, partial [bacterium]|nr:hypothetical protein [bacterium]
KLIVRRKQQVEAIGVVGEKAPEGDNTDLMGFDRYLTTADGVVKKGKLKVYNFDGYPQYFGPRINEVAALVLKGLRNTAVDSIVRMTGSLRYIPIDPETFGLDERIVSKIILRMEREIEANPNPLNEGESFLVKDSLEIGFRLGYGYVVSGDVAYSRKYTLVYPVGNRDAGRFHDKFILNLFLPFERRGRYLPPNHVMMFEDYLEGRGRLKLNPDDTPVVLTLTASKIYLHRHFLSFKDPRRAIFFQDKSLYNELKLRFYLEFADTFRFPLFKTYIQNGTLNRDYIEIDTTDLESNKIKQKALEELIRDGNPASARKVGKQKFIKGHFLEKKRYLSLFGFLRNRSVYRVDRLTETQFPGEGTGDTHGAGNPPIVNHHLQVESRKLKEWRFLDNGERHFSTIRFTGKGGGKNGGKTVTEPLLSLSLRVNDNSTHNAELKEGYLDFINKVALRKKFIRFNPGSHTVNRLWGSTQVFVNFLFYPEAFGNLVNADEESIWQALARVSGKPVEYWQREAKTVYRRGRPFYRRYTGDRYLAVKTKYLVRELRKARKAGDSFKRMRHVVKTVRKAVYTSGQTFQPLLLAVIHKLAGKKNVYMDALVTFPGNKENVFPARASLYNEAGKDRGLRPRFFHFIFDDPSEIYHLF